MVPSIFGANFIKGPLSFVNVHPVIRRIRKKSLKRALCILYVWLGLNPIDYLLNWYNVMKIEIADLR